MHRHWLYSSSPISQGRFQVGIRIIRFSFFFLLDPLTFPRPHQREIIEAALDGFDVYVQAATSFGKSLCFQLPAVIDQGSEFSVSIQFPFL
jgi:hypothetical protein